MNKKIGVFSIGIGVVATTTIVILPVAMQVNVWKSSGKEVVNSRQFKMDDNSKYIYEKYEINQEGFLRLMNDMKILAKKGGIAYNDLQITAYYQTNIIKMNGVIQLANKELEYRGFWGSIGNFFKHTGEAIGHAVSSVENAAATVATSAVAAITLGQVDSVNQVVIDEFHKTGDEFVGIGKSISDMAGSFNEVLSNEFKILGDTLGHINLQEFQTGMAKAFSKGVNMSLSYVGFLDGPAGTFLGKLSSIISENLYKKYADGINLFNTKNKPFLAFKDHSNKFMYISF